MLGSNRKKKLKQNSDDITKGGLFKRIMKQKPNSFGGCTNKILENKLLNGSFYSDFNIFEIYDEFVNEQANIILDDEIKYIINKYELFD